MTDNSCLAEKLCIRRELIELAGKRKVRVLDLYSGRGLLWKRLKKEFAPNIEIDILAIEKEKGKNDTALCGDNLKFLDNLDLQKFDLIDVDAYGVPVKQLKKIKDKGFKGFICVTLIQSQLGTLPIELLKTVGITKEMFSRCPTLFGKSVNMIYGFLYKLGCRRIRGYRIDRKNYFYTRFE